MHPLDLTVILAYFAATIGLGLWVSRSQRTASDYFLGARGLPAWAIMFSIVATETSALTVISVPGLGARGDLTFLQLTFGYLAGRILVAIWLLPGYFRGDQETAYARLESRFGTGTRRLVSAVFLVTRFLGDGVRLFVCAIPLALITGWSVPQAIVAMGLVTMVYTLAGGLKAVVWVDVLQLAVYVAGGVAAIVVAWHLAGGPAVAFEAAHAAGKLRVFDWSLNFTTTYTFVGGLIGGAMLSAASHGTDHLIVQRLLASRSLRDARAALVGSGVMVIMQFVLFLVVGISIWAAGFASGTMPPDQIFPHFIITSLPVGIAGLVIAGILAAAMSTVSSSINALASSATFDLYAGWTGRTDPVHLLRVGKWVAALWAVALIGCALAFNAGRAAGATPAIVLALSIASVTYGGLLGTYLLAGWWPRARGRDVVGAILVTLPLMLIVIFAYLLLPDTGHPALTRPLAALAHLAWPWYVPLGTALTVAAGVLLSCLPARTPSGA